MDDDVDVVVGGTVQVVSLDDLESLVHERGGVARDLGSHVPVGVGGGLLLEEAGIGLGVLTHLGELDVAEGTAGRGQDDPPESALGKTLDALEDGAVLGIRGENLDAVLHREGHDGGTAGDEGLLVGEADVLTGFDGGDGGGKARAAHDAGHGGVYVRVPGNLDHAVGAEEDLGLGPVHVLDHPLELLHVATVRDGHHLGLELLDLLGHHVEVAAGGERHDLKLVGVLLRDVQSLRADGAGGTEQGDLLDVPVAE
mmetsp:Transcript_8303/g.36730  ORF Transcript_8303/g.36730 Transcript_8303/m.36730 type:complete len:255 (+) Transcript_8303:1657-2421(+)